ncbi:hypothetical protein QBC34DRAFT_466211 [Podospora aff. communis PSN243]|uniref:NTF2 domain-containing protein n=1 Tax=Podospora aff. communis PSN243 TaxID=3040156 RepID=A0AAV9GJ99_9PEZI|nr:hypothetical protein QBC34DRAFT_466211 [Podospora aff. communis PSN243]
MNDNIPPGGPGQANQRGRPSYKDGWDDEEFYLASDADTSARTAQGPNAPAPKFIPRPDTPAESSSAAAAVPAVPTEINPPGQMPVDHDRAPVRDDAKLVFFSLQAAQRFFNMYQHHALVIGNHSARVRRNNIRVPASTAPPEVTCVLVIEGPLATVEPQYLYQTFKTFFEFQTDAINVIWETEYTRRLEFHFGSFRA